jgi:branched-chain amino acid transport system substrate-binding protein
MSFLGKPTQVCLLVASVLALSACGGGARKSRSAAVLSGDGKTVDIYSSLPLQGPSRRQGVAIVNGIKLALSQAGGKAGPWTVNYQSLDDSTAAAGQWEPSQTAANARQAAADPRVVYYIGEFNSDASEVSIPILNVAGVPQVSPANTYVGLTTNEPGSASGEPQKYYPTRTRTFLRIVPSDSIQAAADLLAMKQAGCTKVALANDKEPYGTGLAQLLELEKESYGIDITSNTGIDPNAPSSGFSAATIKAHGPDCFAFAGIASDGAVQITKDVNAVLPKAKIFGPDGLCTSAWTNPKLGGVPASIDPLIQCTVPTLDLPAYPGGKTFLAAYKAKYRVANPDPYAIYGYEAMKLGLDTIAKLGAQGDGKSAVLKALFATRDRDSVLGTYSFNRDGDTTLKSFGLYKVGASGDPVFFKTLTPTRVR